MHSGLGVQRLGGQPAALGLPAPPARVAPRLPPQAAPASSMNTFTNHLPPRPVAESPVTGVRRTREPAGLHDDSQQAGAGGRYALGGARAMDIGALPHHVTRQILLTASAENLPRHTSAIPPRKTEKSLKKNLIGVNFGIRGF